MLIFPAIDLRGGQCVRLTQGDYAQEKIYSEDPSTVARSFEEQGAKWLHIVDLDGAKAGKPVNLETVRSILAAVHIPVQLGGGIRSLDSVEEVLALGVSRVIVGTKLVQDESFAKELFRKCGSQVVAGIDAREGKVAISGWTEDSALYATDLARSVQEWGGKRIIATDVARDGMLNGPSMELYRDLLSACDLAIIASGGVSSLDDIRRLTSSGVEGVIVGKALYEGRFSLEQAIVAGNLAT